MKALLVVNPKKEAAGALAGGMRERLRRYGFDVSFLSYLENQEVPDDVGIAISLGGDGTVLFAARSVVRADVPILPVNLGTLGFIATVPPTEWEGHFTAWLEGTIAVSHRIMLLVRLERHGSCVFEAVALNDAVISSSGIAKTIRLNAKTGAFCLAGYRSDGLIAATPTGSTAYSASAGGPILDPETEAIILNPICPFTLLHRPLVMPADDTIVIEVEREQRSGILLTIDGQIAREIESGDLVIISKTPCKAKLLASGRGTFYHSLHSKLVWAPGPEHRE